jgi:hypothetical protein
MWGWELGAQLVHSHPKRYTFAGMKTPLVGLANKLFIRQMPLP